MDKFDLKVWGIKEDNSREQVTLDCNVTGNDTDGYDIVISKKSTDDKNYDLSTLNWTDFGCDIEEGWALNDAECISLPSWDIINSTTEPRVLSTEYLYAYSDATSMSSGIGDVTKNATNMNTMFTNNHNLLKVSSFNTKKAEDMAYMFCLCENLTEVGTLNTENVKDMSHMFDDCASLNEIGGLDFSSATDIDSMLDGCTSLKKINFTNVGDNILSNIKSQLPASLEDITMSFKNDVTSLTTFCKDKVNLVSINLDGTSNITNTSYMFNGCSSLNELSKFDTSNVTKMNDMFNGCESLTTVPEFNTQNVTNMDSMFGGCESLTTVPKFNTQNVTNMMFMFRNCKALTIVPEFDTSNATNMNSMFYDCTSLTTVPEFDTYNVEDMMNMFRNCSDSELSDTSRNNILKMCLNSNVPFIFMRLKSYVFGGTTIDASKWNTLPSYNDFTNAGWRLE